MKLPSIGIKINNCSECDKLNKAIEIYNMLDWETDYPYKAIGFDKETQEILLAEEQIIRIIQMVNPIQEPRKIRLVSKDELLGGCDQDDAS